MLAAYFLRRSQPPHQAMARAMATSTVAGEAFMDLLRNGVVGADVVVIDVREQHELALGTIHDSFAAHGIGDDSNVRYGEVALRELVEGGALAQDADDFEGSFGFEKPRERDTIVFTCASGVRSAVACQAAEQAGFFSTVNYSGGWNEWQAQYHRSC